jgi:hypothetical protein
MRRTLPQTENDPVPVVKLEKEAAPRRSTRARAKPTVFSPSKPETMRMAKSKFGVERVVNEHEALPIVKIEKTEQIVLEEMEEVEETETVAIPQQQEREQEQAQVQVVDIPAKARRRRRRSLVELHEETYQQTSTRFSSYQRKSPPAASQVDITTPVVSRILSKIGTEEDAFVFRSPTAMMRTPHANRDGVKNTIARARAALREAQQLTERRNLPVEVPSSAQTFRHGTPCAKKYLSSLKKRSKPNLKFMPYVSPVADMVPQLELSFRHAVEAEEELEESEHNRSVVSFFGDEEDMTSVLNETIVDSREVCEEVAQETEETASSASWGAWTVFSWMAWAFSYAVLAAWTYHFLTVTPLQPLDYTNMQRIDGSAFISMETVAPAAKFGSEFASQAAFVLQETSADLSVVWEGVEAAAWENASKASAAWQLFEASAWETASNMSVVWEQHMANAPVVEWTAIVSWWHAFVANLSQWTLATWAWANTMWVMWAQQCSALWGDMHVFTVEWSAQGVVAWQSLVEMVLAWEAPFASMQTFPTL